MKLIVIAIGTRMPAWIAAGFAEYAKRMPRNLPLELVEIRPEPRGEGKSVPQLLAAEAARVERALPRGARRIALDERGRELDTQALARWLSEQQRDGGDLAFLIGGADGLAPGLKTSASLVLRLSAMTLPHGLARVLLAEQLYRASAILQGHPYHRE
jgi:23S rRNA (pseudouridine1915-N3)-methyltransferase